MAANEEKTHQEEEKQEHKDQEAAEQEGAQPEGEESTESNEENAESEGEEQSDADKRIKELEKQLEDLNEKHLRLFSEFDNYKKRTKKEKSELIKSAGEDVIGELLPVLDDFERAISSNREIEAEGEQIEQLKNGFELIYNKMKKILEEKGLQEMEAEGEEFNTDRHEAMTKMPVEDEEQKNKVVEVVQKGYYLNDKVLRYAKVVVGQ
jgi:molecular chaperone GrpE